METSKHTPGPWHTNSKDPWESEVLSERGGIIAECNTDNTEELPNETESQEDDRCAANARLMAAAPDLLAALKGLVDVIDECWIESAGGIQALINARETIRETKDGNNL